MKKDWVIRILLLLGYCIPFAFLSVNGDGASKTMVFYGLMILGFVLLCWGALKTNNIVSIYIGNILSFISSYGFAKISGMESMGCYFKPFTSYSLMVTISIVVLVIHIILILIYKRKNV